MARFSFWPKLRSLTQVEEACRNGTKAAVFVAGATAALSLLGGFGILRLPGMDVSFLGLFDAAIFAGIAWGFFKFSRVAAVAGTLLFAVERFGSFTSASAVAGLPLTIVILAIFVAATRGTIAYHRMNATEVQPSLALRGD